MQLFDWALLPHFLAVARAGSLRAAADLTGANYGTINRSIQSLEASYGVRLFHRSRQGFKLTESGEELLPLAEEAEAKIIGARKRVEGKDRTEKGKIRFSITPTLAYDLVAPMIARFTEAFPEIEIELRLTSAIESINKNETDVSLRAAEQVKEDVVARKLFQLKIGTYVGAEYLESVVPKAGPEGEGLTWIGWPEGRLGQYQKPSSLFPKAAIRHVVSDGHMRTKFARLNLGMSPLPSIFEDAYPDLRRMPGTGLEPGPWLWIVLHSELQKTVRVRRFVDFLTSELLSLQPVNTRK